MLFNAGRPYLAFLFVALFLWATHSTEAQVVGASLSGTVTDSSGGVIPNAQVTIKNTANGDIRAVVTDRAGLYVAPNLLPGTYQVTITADGFQTRIQNGVLLTVGAEQVFNVGMELGAVNSKIEVTASAPTVDLGSSAIGDVVDSTTVRELPLNGRSWTDLATLEPGVSPQTAVQDNLANGSGLGSRGFGDEMTVSGNRPQWNNYRLDGVSLNDYSNTSGSVLGGNLGVDAIQEFSVLTGNFAAAYGKASGGVVNAITRSGSNEIHGTAYEFIRNSALDARNYFDPVTIPPFRRNQFGAEGGAPILRNKLFVFADYEGIRQAESVTSLQLVPSADARTGLICSVPSSSACVPHTIAVDPNAAAYLPFWPLPNDGLSSGSNGDIGLWDVPALTIVHENYVIGRVDYKVSDKDKFDGTYLHDTTPYELPSSLNDTIFDFITARQMATISETHIASANFVNSARFGFFRQATTNATSPTAINPLASSTALGMFPGLTAITTQVTGLTTFKGGTNAASATADHWNSFQEYDDAFWTHGAHSVKFGGAVERIQDNRTNFAQDGQWNFSSLQNFLTNIPTNYVVGTASQTVEFGFRQTIIAAYAQDDWTLRQQALTFNLGLRWEMVTVPSEVNGKLSVLKNLTDTAPHLGSPYYANATFKDFEPRLGFTWDPFKTGKTSVRGGFGIFDVLPLPYEYVMRATAAAPFSVAPADSSPPQGSFYNGILSALKSGAAQVPYIGTPHRSYVMEYNTSVQRELPGHVTATVAYVGSGGVHLPFRSDDGNIILPTYTSAGLVWPISGGKKINSTFGDIPVMIFEEHSNYNGLQTSVKKAMSHGVEIVGSFTWSKAMDQGSSTTVDETLDNSAGALPWYDLSRAYGPADFNIKRALVVSGVWSIPSLKSAPRGTNLLVNGWEVGTIYRANDGVPFTPEFGTGGDPLGQGGTYPLDFPNIVTGPGCGSRVNPGNVKNYVKTQCFSVPTAPSQAFYTANCDPTKGSYPQCFNLMGNATRNSLVGPGVSELDFSLFKNARLLKDRLNVQFRAEAFNILNRANFNFPYSGSGDNLNTDIFNYSSATKTATINSSAGLIASTSTTSRQIQFGLKIGW